MFTKKQTKHIMLITALQRQKLVFQKKIEARNKDKENNIYQVTKNAMNRVASYNIKMLNELVEEQRARYEEEQRQEAFHSR